MLARRFLIMSWITIVSLLGASACTPGQGSEAVAVVPSSATETASSLAQSSDKFEGEVVEETPMSESELAVQPTGRTEPGAAAPGAGSQAAPEAQPGQRQPGKMAIYEDSTYKFKVDYPADFVFRTRSPEKVAQLKPLPAASFIILNPGSAASGQSDLEPADLEIRVYVAGQTASLDSWIASNGLLPANSTVQPQPFQTANVSGLKVCGSTMIAPGCFYFVMGGGWIYQLTPASLEGETMVNTFMLIQSGTGSEPTPGGATVQVPGMPNTGQQNGLTPVAFALVTILAIIGAGTTWVLRRQRA
jgi:hypothetical protein